MASGPRLIPNLTGKTANGIQGFGQSLLDRLILPDDLTQETSDPRVLAKRSLAYFAKLVNRDFETPPHIELLISELEAVYDGMVAGEFPRLIIAMPPQHGKSMLTSQLFPSWCLGKNPRMRIALGSYGAALAERNSRFARNILTDQGWPWPDIRVDFRSRAVDHWQVMEGGYLHAVGVGGPLTGFSSDLLIVDDPFKDDAEADSETVREDRWTWFQSVVRSRLPKAIVVIQTRWHEDDMIGRILSSPDASKWRCLILRARCDDDEDPLGRPIYDGKDFENPAYYLWPERRGPAILPLPERFEIDNRTWESLFQQRPTSLTGNMFQREWWKRYDPETLALRGLKPAFTAVDSAFKTGVANDWSVAATWGFLDGRAYLIDLFRARVAFPDLCQTLRDIYAKYRVPLVIEDEASGQSLIQSLGRALPATSDRKAQPAIPIIAKKVPRNRRPEQRAQPVVRYVEAGLVFLPEGPGWVNEFIEEHASFPAGKFNDQVETTSISLARLFAGLERRDPNDFGYNYNEVTRVYGVEPVRKSEFIAETRKQRREDAAKVFQQNIKESDSARIARKLERDRIIKLKLQQAGLSGVDVYGRGEK